MLDGKPARRDLERTMEEVDRAFFITLFATFEVAVRSFHRSKRRIPDQRVQTRALLAAVASRRHVPDAVFQEVDRLRITRNEIVHESGESEFALNLALAARQYNHFLARLPDSW